MKSFKKAISSLLCGTMIAALLSFPVFGTSFSDVEDDETVSWAKDAINAMTDLGYIKGYEDGTFQPQRAVSKIETLILMARIMGVEESDYSQSVEWANTDYSATVKAINTTYVDELSYLMYLDTIDLTDLRNYASSANANTSLLRWQAAYLMVKLSGMEEDARSMTLSQSLYSDYDSIPEDARPYVACATELGLMNGMGKDDNGEDYFSPETTLTRAQMATLLNRIMVNMNRYAAYGTVNSIDTKTGDLEITTTSGKDSTYTADENTVVKINGTDADFADIENGSEVMITVTYNNVRIIEAIPGENTTTFYGVISQVSDNAKGQQITIKDYENQSDTATYTLASDCYVDIKGTRGSFSNLKAGNCVRVTLKGSVLSEVYVIDNVIEESGVYYEGIDVDDSGSSYLNVSDSNGNITQYVLSSNNVTVKRNGSASTLRQLNTGDTLTLTITYGKVTDITATSKTATLVGTITEIILSDNPQITLEIDGTPQTFSMTTTTAVTVNNVDGTIYDLRPGNAASIVADGSSIASIESSATAVYGKTSSSGKVQSINTTLKVISVSNSSGGTDTVYYDSSTTFLKSTGKSATAKDVVTGSTINATGSDTTGYFVATIIIID